MVQSVWALWLTLAWFVLLVPAPDQNISCYSCSSLVETECSSLFGLFFTYGSLLKKMRKDCSESNETACGTFMWILKQPDIGTIAVDSEAPLAVQYIQRTCAFLPEKDWCDSIKQNVIDVLNITLFDEKKHCKVCNTSYCNKKTLLEFYNGGRSNKYQNFLVGCALIWIVLITEAQRNK